MSSRITRALDVLRQLSDRVDLTLMEPSLLKDSNHVTILINPEIVARVLLDADENGAAMLVREVKVSRHLAQLGAPVTRPTEKLPPGPHRVDQACVTFWQYESTIDSDVDIAQAAKALKHVHQELLHYPGDLPHFWKSVDQTYQQLQTPDSRRFLSEGDDCFLKEVFKRFQHLKSLSEDVLRPLHGACHLGNVINTKRGHLWLDFDNACLGPIEWDLSCLPEKAIGNRDIDRALMHDMRMLRRWVTSVWCWMIYDRSSEKREAADYHLAILKRQYQETRS